MTDNFEARQAEYDRRYDERLLRDRPKPLMEMSEILDLAARCDNDPEALEAFRASVTPEMIILAHAAQKWDERNPWYSCIMCRDGRDLPRGYMCEACGESS